MELKPVMECRAVIIPETNPVKRLFSRLFPKKYRGASIPLIDIKKARRVIFADEDEVGRFQGLTIAEP
jgi:hypothetical protein